MVNLTILARVQEWDINPGLGYAPDEVKPAYRLLGTLRNLKLISSSALYSASTKKKIAKLVIKKIMEEL